jgi:pyruvate, water dikinase
MSRARDVLKKMVRGALRSSMALCAVGVSACSATGDEPNAALRPEQCLVASGTAAPDFMREIGCRADFDGLASEPLAASIPGARSLKVVLDQLDGDALYFQNSTKYRIHHEFASAHLSGEGRPFVATLAEFNQTEYYSTDRRFVLGAVTYYEGPQAWVLEIAPYDKASPDMIARLHRAVAQVAYFGPALAFHPTSLQVEKVAQELPDGIRVITTDQLYAEIDYQPLNLGSAVGRLRFAKAEELASIYVSFRDIVVLDRVPNDISVVTGMITEEFQTPLSHVNVLAQTRNTPNMGLRNATKNQTLLAFDGQWVRLDVSASGWTIQAATIEEADAFWAMHRPEPIVLPPIDVSITDLRDIQDIAVESPTVSLRDALRESIRSFGGKASHYGVLARTEGVPVRKAFGVPAYYYVQFMQQNGLYERLAQMLADPAFNDDPAVRDVQLRAFRDAIMQGQVDAEFQTRLREKMERDFPGLSMRFRSSTNSEDLDGFPCAGCYESHTGDPTDWEDVLDAVRETWSSIWLFRTFEERSYHGIDHASVAMALLSHHNFPDEEVNGVAVTANPFDTAGLEPGFYVNAQRGGDAEVVHPPPGVTSDQFIVHYTMPGQPVVYISRSSLIGEGETVLTSLQINELSKALNAIHERFSPAYGPGSGNNGWYGLEVDFKFDDEDSGSQQLLIKQARPHPGR